MSHTDERRAALAARWLASWPDALRAWGTTTRVADPVLHVRATRHPARSFAWFNGAAVRVHVDLVQVERFGLQDHAVAVLAHEIGHHVLAPGDARTRVAVAHRTRLGLIDQPDLVATVANLWQDMLINDRLERTGGASMAAVWRALRRPDGPGAPEPLMDLVLRADELLWRLPAGDLTPRSGSGRADREAYALLLSRLVRAYRTDPVGGAAGFAALVRTYLGEDLASVRPVGCSDVTRVDGVPAGIATDPRLTGPVRHPALDPAVVGDLETDVAGDGTGTSQGGQPPPQAAEHGIVGSSRDGATPADLAETMRALGMAADPRTVAATLYREHAAPYLVRFPARPTARASEPLLGALEPWQPGEEIGDIDWSATVLASPVVLPGVTTRRRVMDEDTSTQHTDEPVHLDLFLDSSGSMPDPTRALAPVVLAGAVLALSALRAGASVRVTIWSGPGQVASTPGFVRRPDEAMMALMTHYGGGTSFPLHVLRRTYLDGVDRRPTGPVHVAVVSDAGVSTMFPRQGEDVGIAARALEAAGGGGSAVLNVSSVRVAPDVAPFDRYVVSSADDLVPFAADFARRWWGRAR
ncbi:hypothetical protein [Miniimonas arenae]|uniref:hypothetical protein n=1 Tax=Miniimonas arenae TaxID=676201 RepID=UPI0028A90453|nr:hypothetical protein [Miniimonas arenae]